MILMKFDKNLHVRNVLVPAYKEHVFPTGTAKWIREKFKENVISSRPLGPLYRKYKGQNLTNKKLLLWRTGGYGDMLFITPLIRHLKKKYTKAEINFGCFSNYADVFGGNPFISHLYSLPIPLSLFKQHDFHLHFENTIEKSKNTKRHAVDVFAEHAGITLTDKSLYFRLHKSSIERATVFIREHLKIHPDTKMVAIQSRASSPIRTYPHPLLVEVLNMLADQGIACLVIGMKGHFPKNCEIEGVSNVCGKFNRMMDSIAILDQCDALIAPDSSLTHFAAALKVPTVAIYGPFPGLIRTKYYPLCITLEAKAPCAPCMIHSAKPCPEAQKAGTEWSPCFESIPPERVVEAVIKTLLASG